MRSEAQIEASRLNGAKSHGPISEEGKQRSCCNAVKHGLSARTVVLCNESHALFEQLEDDYLETFQPCSIPELHLVQRMVAADWRLHRAQVVATAIKDKCIFDHKAQDDRENANCDNDYRLGINQTRIAQDLSFVERAEASFERAHARALTELVVLRKLRPAGAQPIQLDRHDVTTTGRNPAQYLGTCGTPEPKPTENVSNEPEPATPAAPDAAPDQEPCIILPSICRDPNDHPHQIDAEPEDALFPPGPRRAGSIPNRSKHGPQENEANEPKPATPEPEKVEPEPCIIIPYYQKFEEEPLDENLPLLPARRLAS